MAERPGRASAVFRSVGMRSILDHLQVVGAGEREDGVHLGALAVEVNGHDRTGAPGQRPLQTGRIERAGLRLDVDQHRDGSGPLDPRNRRHARVGLGDHLVAGSDADGAESDRDRVRPGSDADRVARAATGGEGALELLDRPAEDEPRFVEDGRDRAVDLLSELGYLSGKIAKANHAGLSQ